ncbi:hypothetical protein N9023_02605 [Opitutaceae bacterium]|nr:hypothetical protein [Opitutaceae bacterium]MDB4473873.1 hypothetical protein [Opitutaceae bacterium]
MNHFTPTIRILFAVGVFLFVVGAKLWVINEAGSSLPYQDQIDAEGESVIRPWLEDRLEWREFFSPHNEHRIVFTKLIALGVVAANGQWDAYIQVIINAIIHTALLLVVLNWLYRNIEGWKVHILGLVAILLWTTPFDWENTLQGFQSQVYLVLTFSVLQLIWVLGAKRFDLRWWAGQLCGLLALGSMAGGSIASAAILAVLLIRTRTAAEHSRFHVITAALSALWLCFGLLTRTSVPGHEILRAENLSDVVSSLQLVSTWPLPKDFPFGFLFALPALGLALHYLKRKNISEFDRVWIGIVVWTVFTALATAVFRGQNSPLISRYLSGYSVLVIVQGIAFLKILGHRWSGAGITVWGTVVVVALVTSFNDLREKKLDPITLRMEQTESVVREYLGSKNPTVLTSANPRSIPYPSALALHEYWKHESIRSVMPAAVRPPLLPYQTEDSRYALPESGSMVVAASPVGPQTSGWVWRSGPQPKDSARFIRFKFTGGLGDPEAALHLRLVTNETSVEIIPEGAARNRWRTINVLRPAGEWWLEIEDNDSLDQIAITSPVELGVISWLAEKTIKHHFWWLNLGLLLVAGGVLGKMAPFDRKSSEPT